ncbi:hypothetical protein DMH03_33765 [Amycolatopsis sp. WAC 01376]|nr:hypothetical protein DMH03_33765 [Amycolatopsis sp. WAC 01376]
MSAIWKRGWMSLSWYMSLSMTNSLKLKSRNMAHDLPDHPDNPGSQHTPSDRRIVHTEPFPLRHYDRLRRQLAEELGADPSAPVLELHERILRADAGPLPPPATTPMPSSEPELPVGSGYEHGLVIVRPARGSVSITGTGAEVTTSPPGLVDRRTTSGRTGLEHHTNRHHRRNLPRPALYSTNPPTSGLCRQSGGGSPCTGRSYIRPTAVTEQGAEVCEAGLAIDQPLVAAQVHRVVPAEAEDQVSRCRSRHRRFRARASARLP